MFRQRRPAEQDRRSLGYAILIKVLSFLTGQQPGMFQEGFHVAPNDIDIFPRPHRLGAGAWGCGLGKLRGPMLRGRLVSIISIQRAWDQREIAASLEQDRSFADGCYHLNSLFCLSRRFGNTEAPCERWIGNMKYMYHPVQGPTTTTLCQRLRARAAGLRGNGADDAFVKRLAEVLHDQQRSHAARHQAGISKGLATFRAECGRAMAEQDIISTKSVT